MNWINFATSLLSQGLNSAYSVGSCVNPLNEHDTIEHTLLKDYYNQLRDASYGYVKHERSRINIYGRFQYNGDVLGGIKARENKEPDNCRYVIKNGEKYYRVFTNEGNKYFKTGTQIFPELNHNPFFGRANEHKDHLREIWRGDKYLNDDRTVKNYDISFDDFKKILNDSTNHAKPHEYKGSIYDNISKSINRNLLPNNLPENNTTNKRNIIDNSTSVDSLIKFLPFLLIILILRK